jgi:hypothetical protein
MQGYISQPLFNIFRLHDFIISQYCSKNPIISLIATPLTRCKERRDTVNNFCCKLPNKYVHRCQKEAHYHSTLKKCSDYILFLILLLFLFLLLLLLLVDSFITFTYSFNNKRLFYKWPPGKKSELLT